jgi:ABC-2 type transport system ATP-binding protein
VIAWRHAAGVAQQPIRALAVLRNRLERLAHIAILWRGARTSVILRALSTTMTDESPIIRLEHVVKKFDDFTAVDDVSFDVRRGEVFAFLGPNGAGKTTTIRMLTTLTRPTSGTIHLDGLDPVTRPTDVRRRFGVVFQDPSLDQDLTAWENMQIHAVLYHVPRKLAGERAKTLLETFDLWDRRDDLVKTFSGGMRRRLEIARGLLHTPALLFLDEPTLGLDPQSRNQMWTHVKSLNKSEGVTVFLTTHYMEEAERVADRIAIIDRGKIVAIGSATELKTQTNADSLEGAFLALTGHQIREESVTSTDRMRQMARMWRGARR